MGDLLEELRAFRSELRDSSANSLRAQLLRVIAELDLDEDPAWVALVGER